MSRASRAAARPPASARASRARPPKRDAETRQRLLDTALELFAERGFEDVTVRDLSREARVNLAAINYHFGDKLGLYRELIEGAIRGMRGLHEEQLEAAKDLAPEDQLRRYVRTFSPRIADGDQHQRMLLMKLVRREIMSPSPLGRRVFERGILPRLEHLSEIIARILDCPPDDARVGLCVLSVHAQFVFLVKAPSGVNLLQEWLGASVLEVARATEHIIEFSLAGIRARKG